MIDKFVLALLASIGLAYIEPGLGISGGTFSLETLCDLGVGLIFLFYGLRLSPEKMRAGLGHVRLHLLTQGSTFLLFPLLALPFYLQGRHGEQGDLWLGIFFLACLPSTVSSSVVMVSIAGGTLAGAFFNASLPALLGVFLTPLWMGLAGASGNASFSGVVLKLSLQVLLPVGIGMALHSRLGAWAERHKQALRLSDQTVILLIVYTAFCDSFSQGLFASFSWTFLLLLALGMLSLFGFIFALIGTGARLIGLEREYRIVALFCGSKKSLVHGTVMAKVLFASSSGLGLLLVPLMLYHALQIALGSVIARKMAQTSMGVAPAGPG